MVVVAAAVFDAEGKALEADTVLRSQIPEVSVYGDKHDFGVGSSQMSAINLPMVQVRSIPQLFGEVDVMKSLQRLPGIQQVNDNHAGIQVRGGNSDQNLILMDGATVYNSEHLKGFISIMNADLVEDVNLYKGAFPSRYGGRLSSVVDMGLREGDYKNYHAGLTVGMLSAKLQAEGPIWKGRTSFNFGARASYLNAIVIPLVKKISDEPEISQPYADMNYFDLGGKIAHRFSDTDKLSVSAYFGKDVSNNAPSDNVATTENRSGDGKIYYTDHRLANRTNNDWNSIVASLNWTHGRPDSRFLSDVNLSYSRYRYNLKFTNQSLEESYKKQEESKVPMSISTEDSYQRLYSEIGNLSLAANFAFMTHPGNALRWGATASLQRLTPEVDFFRHLYAYDYNKAEVTQDDVTKGLFHPNQDLTTAGVYVEDEWEPWKWLKVSAGVRYNLYATDGTTYSSVEPRASLRWLITPRIALKASYSRSSQAVSLLSNSNLAMPSDIWVAATADVPVMKSNQYAVAYNHELAKDLNLSVEGYYKTMDNLLEYRDGVSFLSSNGDWERMVAIGEGRSYGVEVFLQRKFGKTTGLLSYTWSKTLRTFNRKGMEINSGKEFYAGNDRRNNFSIVVAHAFNRHWSVSGAWTYYTGRSGTLPNVVMYGGWIKEFDSYGHFASSSMIESMFMDTHPNPPTYMDEFDRYYTLRRRNNYKLPDNHRLDVSVTYTVAHRRRGSSELSLSVYNLYNHRNISQVYVGYDGEKDAVLKGVCLFPFMPSISYTFKF